MEPVKWEQLLEQAEALVKPVSFLDVHAASSAVQFMRRNIKSLVASNHPFLHTLNQYYLNSSGKSLRPVIILLIGLAIDKQHANGYRRLAEITELIHTASLLHDDVVDTAHSRRHILSAPLVFGNKASVLSGDYLLATASCELGKLGHLEIVQGMATAISDLVQGEFMQLDVPPSKRYDFNYYIEKSFRKTASLIAQSCRSVGILANASANIQDSLFDFGKHFGIAFQLIDDKLDFEQSHEDMGKTTCIDIQNGILTAPVLFALKSHGDILKPIIERQFAQSGDLDTLLDIVRRQSTALMDTQMYANEMKNKAIAALEILTQNTKEKAILIELVTALTNRRK